MAPKKRILSVETGRIPNRSNVPKTDSRILGTPRLVTKIWTPFWSFNLASGRGLPAHAIIEIAGQAYNGKTTFTNALAGCVDPKGIIASMDIETVDNQYTLDSITYATNWAGKLWPVPDVENGVPLFHGQMLDKLSEEFRLNADMKAAIIDSIGNLAPQAEMNSETEAASMGRRANMVKHFLIQMESHLRHKVSVLFCINHLHPNLGSQGSITSGGQAMQYKPALKIRLWASKKEDKYWLVKGDITKRKYVPQNWPYPPEFEFVLIPGKGVHRGLTALNDAIKLGLDVPKKDIGRLTDKAPNDEVFWPYVEALKKKYGGI